MKLIAAFFRPSPRAWLLAAALPLVAALAGDDPARAWLRAEYGEAAERRYRDYRAAQAAARGLSELRRLEAVNAWFNRILRFRDDAAVWHKPDYWATPLQSLGEAAGDCEDFALAKYFALTELGVPKARLRLTYVKARIGGPASSLAQAHMILAYYAAPTAEPLILDNLVGEIRLASRRPDLKPVYSFNHDGVWAGAGGAQAPDGPVARLSRWQELLLRFRNQGYAPAHSAGKPATRTSP